MPAMSPTMTEGGIASWKKKEGESFSSGDVLLEIETDKATIDVEAQEDGVLGKIIAKEGEKGLPVGKVIALLVEEGDDISNLEIPKEEEARPAEPTKPVKADSKSDAPPTSAPASPNPTKPAAHIHVEGPMFPSVIRLLSEAGIKDYKKIKGTGVRGMLTKGDVLAYMGKASSPTGTYKSSALSAAPQAAAPPKKEVKPVDALGLRRMIVSGLTEITSAQQSALKGPAPTFDDVLNDYLPISTKATQPPAGLPIATSPKKPDFLDGLL
ncbi:hypothetical protein M408DRAFT_329232 [Serendipita vermifera MAFF 305830]|uniref:Lipoyl-binding domain-containing protein n=1 Tax=Serendipita vermifera MAFF 305830 TaxID=933852 RepID=A0A0C2WRI5_SERVB|nr:hypothetical protein M408DRAFT_329232 [Serendipita vermifera MAFF 305830]